MLPKVIIHNSVSLDGSLTDFEPNMELHYQIAGNYRPDVHLIGSNTVKVGTELYGEGVPPEESKDFEKPERAEGLPYWAITDTRGALERVTSHMQKIRVLQRCYRIGVGRNSEEIPYAS